jgi:predicted nucleic acid-binding protein
MSIAVVDASVWCDALLPGPRRATARAALESYTTLAAPEHLRLEIMQVLRRHARNDLGNTEASAILDVVRTVPLMIVPTAILLQRIWYLRERLTAYDAAYVAAAEHCRAPLLTRDKGLLANADRARCAIHTVGAEPIP